MLQKKKTCDRCSLERVIWKNHQGKKYCQPCWGAHSGKPKRIPTVGKKLAQRSKRRIAEQAIYSEKRKLFLETNPMCKTHLQGICSHYSTDVHHTAGRIGELYLDETKWLALCRACHSYIELNPNFAREQGYSLTKH